MEEKTKKPLTGGGRRKDSWWSYRVNLSPLRRNEARSNPYGEKFDYAEEFRKLDLEAVKEDLRRLMTDSQEWWPADFGHYGPLFVRLAWHSAGSYRLFDGRGGARGAYMRLAPRNSWPDNVNLDKAMRLLWPIKKKYGRRLSWADLLILAGNVALESMGVRLIGFAGGRPDAWERDEITYWGSESEWLSDEARKREKGIEDPLSATQMGLIYVNPEGPGGNPDPKAAAREIRAIFARMGMNDEETVALIAGGHSFGKCHGAAGEEYLGPEPEEAELEEQGLGWRYHYRTGKGPDTFTSGLEGAWTVTPIKFGINFLHNLFKYEWELTRSPAGKHQWVAKDAPEIIPDAHDPHKKHKPFMLTTDLALRYDPVYEKIARRFLENPEEFERAFARAWFKLTHRDLGPRSFYLGPEVPEEVFPWQDPLPERDFDLIEDEDIRKLKEMILSSGLTVSELVFTAWASASTFRASDLRGGANGARIRLKPLRDWEVNNPPLLERVLSVLEGIKREFDTSQKGNKRVSLADLIVLAGCAAVEEAARRAGMEITVPFTPGRVDLPQEDLDVESWKYMEPLADGFRNYLSPRAPLSPEEMLVDKADLLSLSVPEMVVLLGGLRVLKTNWDGSLHGVFTERPETLTNDFFVHLLSMDLEWRPVDETRRLFEGYDRHTGKLRFTATRVDLLCGHHSELRAVAEVYAADDGREKFVADFVSAWNKVMNLDRFDLR
ncbi:catalase/peroxidase HPI [Thermosulfurimonas sp.]|uniref:catalase/peroxidase HPI n=1 Tax=Thermosulfurimonas sp. TaxID=2080236 RepID=UPI0025EC882D|nr:catalase/peroxidase HPI [Thermosulfurimonas sp.]